MKKLLLAALMLSGVAHASTTTLDCPTEGGNYAVFVKESNGKATMETLYQDKVTVFNHPEGKQKTLKGYALLATAEDQGIGIGVYYDKGQDLRKGTQARVAVAIDEEIVEDSICMVISHGK